MVKLVWDFRFCVSRHHRKSHITNPKPIGRHAVCGIVGKSTSPDIVLSLSPDSGF